MSFVPGILTKNWQLKMAALSIAVLLWTVPRFDGQTSQILEGIPVRVQLSDPTWAWVGEPDPAEISVTLSGPVGELISLGVERPPIQIPIDEVISGDSTVRLREAWFRGSGRDGVVVEALSPQSVRLTFEPKEERVFPFSAPYSGELPPGLSLTGPPVITPATTTAYGPASRLEGIDSIPLIPVDLSLVGGVDPFPATVDTTGLFGLVDPLPLEVSVEVPTDSTTTREFPGLTVSVPTLDSDPQLQARPSVVTVTLTGARSFVDEMDPDDLSVSIPRVLANLAPGEEAQVLVVVGGVPEFVEYRVNPPHVRLLRPAGQ